MTESLGWICPRCQVVHAPSVFRCECSPIEIRIDTQFPEEFETRINNAPPDFWRSSNDVPGPLVRTTAEEWRLEQARQSQNTIAPLPVDITANLEQPFPEYEILFSLGGPDDA